MNWIGREKELAALNNEYAQSGFRMMVVYGRRRVGKTKLLNQFSEGRKTVFFTALESNAEINLRGLEDAVFSMDASVTVHPHFQSFEEAFLYIGEMAKKERLLFIIDEYPYLANADHGISSVLQKCIDNNWQNKNIFLILCGSAISFMQEEVLGSKSPLFGRRTSQMDVQPFDYVTSSQFVPNYTPEEKAIVYGVTGGIAKYLELFDPNISVYDNIKKLFFSETGYLFEEPHNLLRQEFRNVPLYNVIVDAIARGAVQMNEISQKTGYSTAALSQAIGRLISVRLVRKDIPILNEKNRRYTQYILSDGMFRFWYRFVNRAVNAISRGYGETYFDQQVLPELHDYMGQVFEEMCQEYTFRIGMQGKLSFIPMEVGKWRGNDNVQKSPADIDVVGIDRHTKEAVIGECKFRNQMVGSKEMTVLFDRIRFLVGYRVKDVLFFSLSGYEEAANKQAQENDIQLFTLDQIYE